MWDVEANDLDCRREQSLHDVDDEAYMSLNIFQTKRDFSGRPTDAVSNHKRFFVPDLSPKIKLGASAKLNIAKNHQLIESLATVKAIQVLLDS